MKVRILFNDCIFFVFLKILLNNILRLGVGINNILMELEII